MKKETIYRVLILACIFAVGSAFALSGKAASTPDVVTMAGRVSCTTCELPNTCKAQTRLSCTLWYVNQGAAFALVTDSHKVYRLSGFESDLRKFAGSTVVVTGNLTDNNTELAILTITPAPAHTR
jgi:hypothetical protein